MIEPPRCSKPRRCRKRTLLLLHQQQQHSPALLVSLLALVLLTLSHHHVVTAKELQPRNCAGVPHHVHLAVGADPSTEMTVSFASTASHQAAPVAAVAIGTSPDNFEYIVVAQDDDGSDENENGKESSSSKPSTRSSYSVPIWDKRDANGPNNLYWSKHYHHVTIRNLSPNTQYYYQPLVAATRHELKVQHKQLRSKQQLHQQGSVFNNEEQDKEQAAANVQAATVEINHQGQRRFLSYHDSSAHPCPAADRVRWFHTAPAAAAPDQETVLAVVGDVGHSKNAARILQHLYDTAAGLNVVLLVGDISYSETNENQWDLFFDFWDDMALPERIPIHICPGNHDVEPKRNKKMFQAYEHRFRMPQVQPAELEDIARTNHRDRPYYPLPYDYGNAYHQFVYGAAHIFMLSAYSSMEPDSKQCKWLAKTLETVDREKTPWLIVGIHVPIYNTYTEHRDDDQVLAAAQHFEPLFVRHRVNLVVSGHVHAYMRTKPVKFGQVHPEGPVYMIVGSSGYQASGRAFASATPEDFVAARDETRFGYGVLHIYNATTAAWEWQTNGIQVRDGNRVFESNQTVPIEFETDHVVLQNQYYL